ncbi:hypothetical protein I552_9005 [Mycobacterium xenopi 3993]|nr:hypothetical protein I552_9005 [Mycobacterium xenopi 3993]
MDVNAVGDQLERYPRSCSSAKTGPGSRWCSGRIALNRCVPTVKPSAIALLVCS